MAQPLTLLARLLLGLIVLGGSAGCGSDDMDLYALTISVTASVERDLGALQFDVTASDPHGTWVGQSGAVECEPLVDALMASNWPGGGTIKVGLVSLHGIVTPGPVVRCSFRSSSPPTPAAFSVEVQDASDTDSMPVDPLPTIMVTEVTPS